MPRDVLLYELGHLLVHTAPQATAEARRFLDAALSVNASHAGAHADVGRLHHIAGRRQEANASFARAVELGSSDAQVHLLVGISVLDEFKGGQAVAAPGESLLKGRRAFARGVELDPSSVLGWTGLGATYVFTNEDPSAGIAALEKALALAPADVNAAFYLVQLYARTGRRAEAQRLVDTVLTAAKPETLAFAHELLQRAGMNASIGTINEAIAKANAGQLKEAVAILDGVLPQLDDPAMRSRIQELRASLVSRIK
jgi:tetratricopeptide (TPR) repeat protein